MEKEFSSNIQERTTTDCWLEAKLISGDMFLALKLKS